MNQAKAAVVLTRKKALTNGYLLKTIDTRIVASALCYLAELIKNHSPDT